MARITTDLEKAKTFIQMGRCVAIPTETVYGLAASIHNEVGIDKIFKVKERPSFDPLIVHISKLSHLKGVVNKWPLIADYLARRFWPGPMTLVLPKHPDLNPKITAGLDTVGVRMPKHPLSRKLIEELDVPLAAPSANKFGRLSPTKAEHVERAFKDDKVTILDGGVSEVGLESSVIAIESDNIVRILRPGLITKEIIEDAVEGWPTEIQILEGNSQASPGHLEDHYQPPIPLIIVENKPTEETVSEIKSKLRLKGSKFVELVLQDDPVQEARKLYDSLHILSESEADFILVEKNKSMKSKKEEWIPIWDRLKKASSLDLSAH
jgi:L-threonylcarbamoyladenylate synthase